MKTGDVVTRPGVRIPLRPLFLEQNGIGIKFAPIYSAHLVAFLGFRLLLYSALKIKGALLVSLSPRGWAFEYLFAVYGVQLR